MFAFQWREFSPPLSSAHRLLQCYHKQKRDRRRCSSWGIPPQPPATRVFSQWASSLEWRHAVTLHILVGKICISFFLFYCEGMLSLVVSWLCGSISSQTITKFHSIAPMTLLISSGSSFNNCDSLNILSINNNNNLYFIKRIGI